jgi:hypothetical protein
VPVVSCQSEECPDFQDVSGLRPVVNGCDLLGIGAELLIANDVPQMLCAFGTEDAFLGGQFRLMLTSFVRIRSSARR